MRIPRPRSHWLVLFFGAFVLLAGGFAAGIGFEQKQSGQKIDVTGALSTSSVINRTKNQPQNVDFSLFWDVWNRVNQKFDGSEDNQKQLYGAIQGSLQSLGDPYSIFFNPDDAKSFQDDLNGQFTGIGAEMEQQGDQMVVVAPLPDSPAQKAGLKPKDIIIKINDTPVDGNLFQQNIATIRGAAGTDVHLTIIRPPQEKPIELTIRRENLHIDSVTWTVRPDKIAVVRLRQFSSDTSDLMDKMADDITKQGAVGLVLDLRSDPGGFLDAAQAVWGEISAKTPLVLEKNKFGLSDELNGTGTTKLGNIPLVALVDGGSASASEIVAGAIQDQKRGTVIGEKTFGKGSVQDLEPLPGGAELKLTIAHWFTPQGRGIDKHGIDPDIVVTTPENKPIDADPVLDKGIEVLLGKK